MTATVAEPVAVASEPAAEPVVASVVAEAAIDAAVASFGVTRVLSYQIASALQSGLLSVVLETFEPAAVPVSLVYNKQGRLPVKLRAFIDFAQTRLRQSMATPL